MGKDRKIFLSYRREGGAELARLVRDALRERGFDVFMDVEDLRSGPFNTALLEEIQERPGFVVFLTPDSMERCVNADDWLRLEIAHAIKHKRNIVPVRHKHFEWPKAPLPAEIASLPNYQGLEPSHEFFEASMDKLSRLLGVPGDGHAHHESGAKPIVWAVATLLLLLCASAIGWAMLHKGAQPGPASASASASAPIVVAQSAPPATPASATPISTPEPTPLATPVSSQTAAPTAAPSPSPAPQAAARPAAATPEGKNYVDDLGGGVKLVMNWIPAGKFTMGSPASEPDRAETEGPQIEVTLGGYWMGKFEVTQAQYEAIAGSNPSYFKSSPDNPVEMVGWTDAMDFCKMLSGKTGKIYTLPSESQWEYACRAGTKTRWSFGDDSNDAPKFAWLISNSGDKGTRAVGGGAPNAFGLYDMHGNVFEWCLDWYHPSLAGAPTDGSAWNVEDPNNPYRVLRGGSWHFDSALARSAYRSGNVPSSRFYTLGFRVARTP